MSDPLDKFARQHGLGAEASVALRRLVGEMSAVGDRRALLADAIGATEPSLSTARETTEITALDDSSASSAGEDTAPESSGVVRGPFDLPPEQRYLDRGPVGEGGMGEVRRVYDRVLEREVAFKTLHWRSVESPRARARFEAESTMTAGLEHPGIVPVYDRGRMPDGRPWYTMKFVRGQTLSQAARSGLSVRRLVDCFQRLCDAMAYAHSRGVIHRDLKPANVMVGAFGEVLVMDWGLARPVDRAIGVSAPPRAVSEHAASVVDEEIRAEELTRAGDILGTPSYMPPEQLSARFGKMGPHSDVFALGATLYALLAGRSPWAGQGRRALQALMTGERPPPLQRGPSVLRAIVARAMEHDIGARYPDAGALGAAVRAWLDGEARRVEALALLERARPMASLRAERQSEARRLRAQASAILGPLPPFAPLEHKAPGWALEDAAQAREQAAHIADVDYVQTLRAALEMAPDLVPARQALNAHYRARLTEAEAQRDTQSAIEYAALLRSHDPIANAEWLRGDGSLTLMTEPPRVQVALYRIETRNRERVPVFAERLPPTPLVDHRLPMGSYLLRFEAPGRAPVGCPVLIERQSRWDNVPPGDTAPRSVRLPVAGELGPDDCFVPAGWFYSGGDPEAADGLPRQRVWLDDFVMRRHPVTAAEYLRFLDALVAAGRSDEAHRHAPSTVDGGVRRPLCVRGPDGTHTLRPDSDVVRLAEGPIDTITWHGAAAYARWRASVEGLPWRLPHEFEWEKAARGVDGRWFATGDHLDPTRANIASSRAGPPRMVPVTAMPSDESIYGVRGLNGNVRDFCGNAYDRGGPAVVDGRVVGARPPTDDDYVTVRGGSWISLPHFCRAATRFGLKPHQRLLGLGFRLVRSL